MPHMEGIFINGEKAKFHPEDILDTNASQYTEEIGTATKEWLSENLTPESAGVVDKTLSIEGAAADAKETGNRINGLKNALKEDIGIGIESTVLNPDYTLTITFTDGTSYTTPSIRGAQGLKGETGASGVYIGDTEPTDEGIKVWIDTSENSDKSSNIVGIGQVGYMVITSDTSHDKTSPIVGVGQADYMKVKE